MSAEGLTYRVGDLGEHLALVVEPGKPAVAPRPPLARTVVRVGPLGLGKPADPAHPVLRPRLRDGWALRTPCARTRVLTLTGAPGCGKSRLANRAGAASPPRFGDGVWLVELAPVVEPERVAAAVGVVLEVGERPGRSMVDALTEALADRELLLILDNCEHLAGRDSGPGRSSRRRLPVGSGAGHQPLGARSGRRAGVGGGPVGRRGRGRALRRSGRPRLERPPGRRRRPRPDPAGVRPPRPSAARDRLAAAWSRVLSPTQIADRLDDALSLLSTTARAPAPRQETMEATVDWSYRLLLPAEQRLFRPVVGVRRWLRSRRGGGDRHRAGRGCAVGVDRARRSLLDPRGAGGRNDHALSDVRAVAAVRRRHLRRHRGPRLDPSTPCRALPARGTPRRHRARARTEGRRGCARWIRTGTTSCRRWSGRAPSDRTSACACAPRWRSSGTARPGVNEGRAYTEELLNDGTDDRRLRATVLSERGAAGLAAEGLRAGSGAARGEPLRRSSVQRPAGGRVRRLRTLALIAMSERDTDAAVKLLPSRARVVPFARRPSGPRGPRP